MCYNFYFRGASSLLIFLFQRCLILESELYKFNPILDNGKACNNLPVGEPICCWYSNYTKGDHGDVGDRHGQTLIETAILAKGAIAVKGAVLGLGGLFGLGMLASPLGKLFITILTIRLSCMKVK